jgi:hypothetical protein
MAMIFLLFNSDKSDLLAEEIFPAQKIMANKIRKNNNSKTAIKSRLDLFK